jgi:hypothetical protein
MEIRGKAARLFICPDCTIPVRVLGRTTHTPYIFAVDDAGEVWDAARIAREDG